MTVLEKGLLQQTIDHVLQECEECREDMGEMYTQYPQATWLWSLACDDHRVQLRTCTDLYAEYEEIRATIPILRRVAKGKTLLADPKLSLRKAVEYKNALAVLESEIPRQYREAVIVTLERRLDNIRTDMLYWLKPS